ncbi:MAG: uroporphyrinogen-III C-methyltransferase [Alphaproteobacteria bacterium]|nr:MAG: uroporphyrinogen-III C-methyltransferase [Alphaproteobacteria bacterium]
MSNEKINQGRFAPLPEMKPGWVWLVGAGPGDPGLVTRLAVHALTEADVVVYDALVSKEILAMANPAAEMIDAGKKGGAPSPKQEDISATLIRLAKAGRKVLRLKGGDPFTFARGGEEGLALIAEGIPFRMVPGITSGVGGLGYAGIPATHRDMGHAVTFLTGHMAGGSVPANLDWAAIAKGSPTIVLYMAMKHVGTIAGHFMAAGRAANEPVAVISKATTPEQKVLETTLAEVASDIEKEGMKPPALIVIGKVVSLRKELDWLTRFAQGEA